MVPPTYLAMDIRVYGHCPLIALLMRVYPLANWLHPLAPSNPFWNSNLFFNSTNSTYNGRVGAMGGNGEMARHSKREMDPLPR